ncbi:MAG TPA: radical SAM protein [Candidatus Dormibacteraeota bacterium]|nr:radical SAM protein [Candidatus Dormibacteraeota bacterium]
MQCCVARPDGSIDVLPGIRPAARSGSRLVPLSAADVTPLPESATVAHLPGRRALGLTRAGEATVLPDDCIPVAAVLPVGHLRTLLPASEPQPGAPRLPLFGYTAIAEHRGRLVVAALRTDELDWWEPRRFRRPDLPEAVDAARRALPGNRIVEQLSVCALDHNCYTAQNTFYRRYEAALPASPACNADCLGCISLQPDGVPTPQPRMTYAPTPEELADLADYHLGGDDAHIVSFGQGCEGEPLTRGDALEEATARIRRMHPEATIHVNTNGSNPRALRRMIAAGCNSVRISAISFTDAVFRAYYRPIGYTLDDVLDCGRAMRAAGGQVCLNLLTFPGVTDAPDELERTLDACREMGVMQVQWRSLNVDHDWLARVLPAMQPGMGMRAALDRVRRDLPDVEHGNFTRPFPVRLTGAAG